MTESEHAVVNQDLSEGLSRLFAGNDEAEDEYIPGEGDSRPPPPILDDLGPIDLAKLIRDAAQVSDSAAAKTRGLVIASQLFAHCENDLAAEAAAREATEASPKLSFASLLLRKHATQSSSSAIERSLESVSRLAAHPESRRHATRTLLRRYASNKQTEQAGKLLDQTARSNEADLAVLLERAVHRAAEEATLAGVVLPIEFEADFFHAHEIITGQSPRSSRDDEQNEHESVEMALIRAARRLKRGDGASAIKPLVELLDHPNSPFGLSPPAKTDLLELSSSLRAAEDDGTRDAALLLKDAYAAAPSRRVFRNLVARIVELGDKNWLASLLDQADPGSGTFAIEERIILASLAGTPVALGDAELTELGSDQVTLARALAPLKAPALDLGRADTEKLLIQLGAGLSRLRNEPAKEVDAQAALEELEKRGEMSELTRAIRTGIALFSDAPADLIGTIRELTGQRPDARSHLIIAALLERLEAGEGAVDAYKRAGDLSQHCQSAIVRGLRAQGQEPESLALHVAQDTDDLRLRFSRRVSLALTSPRQARAGEIAAAARQLADEAEPGLRALVNPLALAGALNAKVLAAGNADALLYEQKVAALRGEDLQPLYDGLLGEETFLGKLCLLREFYISGRNVRSLSDTMAQELLDGDASEQALATWLDREGTFSLSIAARSETPGPGSHLPWNSNRAQSLVSSATQLATGAFARAAESMRLHPENFPGMAVIADDVSEIEGDTSRLTPIWLERAQSASDDSAKRYAYERLATLDERRGDNSSATLWRKTLAEKFPAHIPSLLGLEGHYLRAAEVSETTQERLAESLPPSDREAYQLLLGARSLASSDLRGTRKNLEPLLALDKPPALALRGLASVARDKRDEELLLACLLKLANRANTDLDKASTALELAHLLTRGGRIEEARVWAQQSFAQRAGNFPAAWLLHSLASGDDPLEYAETLEALARTARHESHRAELWSAAAEAWVRAEDPSRAAPCFEQTLSANPLSLEAFTQLCSIRNDEKRYDALQNLIEDRLQRISSSSPEALALELRLADLFATLGNPDSAKKHLERALILQPDNANALRSHAEISAQLGAHESAERSLVALKERLAPSVERTAVLRSLARLYDTHLDQLERAMDAYQEVLLHAPEDEDATSCLIDVFSRLGFAERATALQTQLIQKATSPEKKRAGALGLAAIYENVAHDIKRAGATLERTRKAWPLDAEALEATVLFMDRHGSDGSRGFLLDRVGKEARRNLEAGHLDHALIDTLARVARLSGRVSEAEGCLAAHAALLAEARPALSGAGIHALNSRVDEVIAPRGLAAPLRNLLRKTGPAMDAAFSVDLGQLGAAPLREGPIFDRVAQMAEALRIPPPQLFVSTALGARCLPVTSAPARLLLGAKLEALGGRERDYLLLRGFKLLELGVGALARSRDEDRWPMLAALLQLFAPNWQPPAMDPRKAAQAKAAIEQGLARAGYDDDVPMLALEAIGSIGDQPGSLGEATRVLANRAALIAVGDLSSVLTAIAAGEGVTLSDAGPSRTRWIETHQEARDLLLFSTGAKHARAREGLGLVEKSPRVQENSQQNRETTTQTSRAPTLPSRAPAPQHSPQALTSRAPAPPKRPKPPNQE